MKMKEKFELIRLSIIYNLEVFEEQNQERLQNESICKKQQANHHSSFIDEKSENHDEFLSDTIEHIREALDNARSYFFLKNLIKVYESVHKTVINDNPFNIEYYDKLLKALIEEMEKDADLYNLDSKEALYYSVHAFTEIYQTQAQYYDVSQKILGRLYSYSTIVGEDSPDYKLRFLQGVCSLVDNPHNIENEKILMHFVNDFPRYYDELFSNPKPVVFLSEKNKSEYDSLKRLDEYYQIISVPYHYHNSFTITIYQTINLLIDKQWDAKYKNDIENLIKQTKLYYYSNNVISFLEKILDDFYMIVGDIHYVDYRADHESSEIEYLKFRYDSDIKKHREMNYSRFKWFDTFASKIYLWLKNNKNSEFDNLITCLEKYFSLFVVEDKDDDFKELVNKQNYQLTLLKNDLDSLDVIFNPKIIEKLAKDNFYNDIDLELIKSANENWHKWIILGQYFYNLLNKFSGNMDYSGCVIYWCKCIEDMVKNIIFEKIENEVLANDYKYKNLSNKIISNKQDKFTLGTICYLFKDNHNCIKEAFEILENENVKIDEFKSAIEGIVELNKYRIDTAHREPLNYATCEVCKDIIFISKKIIKTLSKFIA